VGVTLERLRIGTRWAGALGRASRLRRWRAPICARRLRSIPRRLASLVGSASACRTQSSVGAQRARAVAEGAVDQEEERTRSERRSSEGLIIQAFPRSERWAPQDPGPSLRSDPAGSPERVARCVDTGGRVERNTQPHRAGARTRVSRRRCARGRRNAGARGDRWRRRDPPPAPIRLVGRAKALALPIRSPISRARRPHRPPPPTPRPAASRRAPARRRGVSRAGGGWPR
jgi:hypothetical protein